MQTVRVYRIAAGSEHVVYWDASTNDVFKLTQRGIYGESYFLDEAGRICQRSCTPLEYLSRLDLWDTVFPGFSLHPLGINDSGQIITRQPFIHGVEPTQEEVNEYLEQEGWNPIKKHCWLWNYVHHATETVIWLGDARNDNFVLQDGRIAPIDIRLWEPDPEELLKQQLLRGILRTAGGLRS